MFRNNLMRGVSAGAIAILCFSSAALAQETLPTIDINPALRTAETRRRRRRRNPRSPLLSQSRPGRRRSPMEVPLS